MADDEKTEFCSNCKRDIPAINYVMHIAHCKRNIVLCKECQEPVAISQQEEHFEEYHVKVKCECGLQMEKMQLEEHKENECPCRKVTCSYCELELPFSEMDSHRDYCGSRTEMCEKCNRYIKFKDMDTHISSDCKLPVAPKPKPVPPGNDNYQEYPGFPPEMLRSMGLVGATFLTAMQGDRGRLPLFSDDSSATGNTDQWVEYNAQAVPVPRNNVVARGRGAFPDIKPIKNIKEKKVAKKTNQSSVYGNNVHLDDEEILDQQIKDDHLLAAYLASTFGEKTDGLGHDADYSVMPTAAPERELFSENNGLSSSPSGIFADGYQALEETCLPCEFCGSLCPASELIQHQSGCQVDVSGPPSRYPELRSPPRSLPPLNSELEPRQLRNNKRTELFDDSEWNQDIGDTDEDTFLPCEFCNELLPISALVQHQSNCDMGPQSRPVSVARGSVTGTIINPLPLLNNSPQSRHRAKPQTQFDSDESLIPESLDEEPRKNESKNQKQGALKTSSSASPLEMDQINSYQNRSTARGSSKIIDNNFVPRTTGREMKRPIGARNQMPLSSYQLPNRRSVPAEERSKGRAVPEESDETPQSAFKNVRNYDDGLANNYSNSKNRGKREEVKAAAGSRRPTQNEEPIPNGRNNQNSSDMRRPRLPLDRTSDNRDGPSVNWSPVFQDASNINRNTVPLTATKQPKNTSERRGSGGDSSRPNQKVATGSVSQQRGGARLPSESRRPQGGARRTQRGTTSAGTKSSSSRKKIV